MKNTEISQEFEASAWDVCKTRLGLAAWCLSIGSYGFLSSIIDFRAEKYDISALGGGASILLLIFAGVIGNDVRKTLSALSGKRKQTKLEL